MKRITFCVLVIGLFCFGGETTAAQCDYEPKLTLQDHFKRADEVFVGKVVEATKIRRENSESFDVVIKFEVTQTWKQDRERFAIVKEISGTTAGFESGREWLLYASRSSDGTLRITRNCCSRTRLLSIASKQGDIKAFKKMGEKPKKIIG